MLNSLKSVACDNPSQNATIEDCKQKANHPKRMTDSAMHHYDKEVYRHMGAWDKASIVGKLKEAGAA